ncbi:MAG: hypothetical protein CMD79_04060 [Gammaproteobacteria bacterium]|nr:hypothetical protein [Gammaproteobacteria bacterium]|tara:strand:+ start:28875 stop:30221 length:1347 start_codon:yes stop_codon:yes gene_type:complete
MKAEKITNYIFENNVLRHKSLISDFSNEIFKEFDNYAKKINLSKKIDNLMYGEVVNNSENQAATHPLIRENNGDLKTTATHNFLYKIKLELKKTRFKYLTISPNRVNLITLGIGGSFEGPKLLSEAREKDPLFKYDFITGSDLSEFSKKLHGLEPKKTFFVVFSKSFKTDETIELFKKAIDWSKDHNKFLFITSNPNEVKKYKCFGKRFTNESIDYFDKTIGGRYSIWLDIVSYIYGDIEFRSGGKDADKDLKENKDYLNFIKRLSYSDIWNHNVKGKDSRAVLSYIWRLRSLPNYIQQLEMESLGKPPNPDSEFKKTGQIIFGGYGPTAQHSYFQLLHQGTHKLCADIVTSYKDEESLAYAQAITQSKLLAYGEGEIKLDNESKINGNVPVNLFMLKDSDEHSLGYFIASWEHRVFITASILGINPFDQFGVSAGKIYTKKYLADKY